MNTDNIVKQRASLFNLDGVPEMGQAIPLVLQHVVVMIVDCVIPAIIISGAADIGATDRVLLIQISLMIFALATLLQLFPLGNRNSFHPGSGLPVILGVSSAYIPSIQAIAEQSGIPVTLGAQIIGSACATLADLTTKKARKLSPPLIAGTVVFTVGLSLYPTAINYMTGGAGQPTYGAWQNWVVATFTLVTVTTLNHFARGFLKLTSIPIGMTAGCVFSMFFGIVSFGNVAESGMPQLPQVIHLGVGFEASACVALGPPSVISSVQATGDSSATAVRGLGREPTTSELHGVTLGYGFSNIIDVFPGCLPTATYSQNVDIVATTKVVSRVTLGLSVLIILAAGLFPKFSALLTTIPYAALGGAAVSVLASITMTGIKLVVTEDMDYRNTSVAGLVAALGMDVSQASISLSVFPIWVTIIFGKSPVVTATLVAILLNVALPKDTGKVEEN